MGGGTEPDQSEQGKGEVCGAAESLNPDQNCCKSFIFFLLLRVNLSKLSRVVLQN